MSKLKLTLKLCFLQNNEYIVQDLNSPISSGIHVLHIQHLNFPFYLSLVVLALKVSTAALKI